MKNLLFAILCMSTAAMSQTCPVITSSSLYNVTTDSGCVWALSVGYKSAKDNFGNYIPSSIKVNISIPVTSPTCMPVYGEGAFTIFSISGFCNSTPTHTEKITPGIVCDSTYICATILALQPQLNYSNGRLYFDGKLICKETGKTFTTSPYTPDRIGYYVAVNSSGDYSKTVYVSCVGKQTTYKVFTTTGQYVKIITIPANTPLERKPGFVYIDITK